jgi:hypothetical protein
METRTRVVVLGALAIASGVAFGVIIRKPHAAPHSSSTAPSTDEDETDPPVAAAEDFDAPGSVDGPHHAERSVASDFLGADEKPVLPPPPKNPETVAMLESKYHDSSPAEMQAALDSLLEVLDAHTHHRVQGENQPAQSELSPLYDELGWLSAHCAH